MKDHLTISQYKALTKKKPKYGNKKNVVDGIKFDSLKEANRYCVLKLLAYAGEIQDLKLQVSFPFVVNRVKIGSYKADFVYSKNGAIVVEDVKGIKTQVYRLKKKLLKAIYNIDIIET